MSDHEWRQVRVTFRKAVSDGNYGTESAEIMLEDWILNATEGASKYTARAEELVAMARDLVQNELLDSPSSRVRESLTGIKTYRGTAAGVGPDDDGEE